MLRLFLALSPSLSERAAPGLDGGDKDLGVIRSYLVSDPIPWKPPLALLQQFLQGALVVVTRQLEVFECLLEPLRGHRMRDAKTGIDVDSPEHRLQDISEQRGSSPAAGLFLALAEPDVAPQIQRLSDPREPGFADNAGPQLRQFALRRVGVPVVEVIADDEIQHRVPQEFQPLVGLSSAAAAFVAEGTVLQREIQQMPISETKIEFALEISEQRISLTVDLWGAVLLQRNVRFSGHRTCAR